jgi:hypothetical protein
MHVGMDYRDRAIVENKKVVGKNSQHEEGITG